MHHAVVAAAMTARGLEACVDGVVGAKGVRIEFSGNAVNVATIDLSDATRMGIAQDRCWIEMEGVLPDQVRTALPGMPVETIVRHAWTDGSGLVVSGVTPRGDRTRIDLARS